MAIAPIGHSNDAVITQIKDTIGYDMDKVAREVAQNYENRLLFSFEGRTLTISKKGGEQLDASQMACVWRAVTIRHGNHWCYLEGKSGLPLSSPFIINVKTETDTTVKITFMDHLFHPDRPNVNSSRRRRAVGS